MNFKTLPGCLRVAVMFGLAAATHSIPYARAATSGANGTHDPSRIVESDGKFYFCSTGGNCASSVDGLKWSDAPLRIPIPAWAGTYTEVTGYSGNQGIWAPDLIYANGKYYIYYSFCGKPASKAPCVIGLYTTPTLDANAMSFRLTDEGKVVNSPPNTTSYQFSTIDPAPVVDAKGELWSAWGSGYGKDASLPQIFVTRLTAIGLPLTSDPGYKPPMTLGYGIQPGRIEGSYLHYHAGYYYLWWNSGSCCSGSNSTYTMHVARSTTVSGPYTEKGSSWFASSGSMHGPGHIGIYSACGVERFTYHYYPDSGGSVLGENELSWGADGWPAPGVESTTALKPCGTGSDGMGGGGAGGNSNMGGSSSIGGSSDHSSGGAAGTGAQGGTSTQGGTSAVAGSTNSTPSDAAPERAASDDAGCSCSLPTAPGEHHSFWPLLLASAALLSAVRRKRS